MVAMYCRQHAKHGMVDVSSKLSLYGGCGKGPRFDTESKVAVYCGQHEGDGMVNIRDKLYAHEDCIKVPNFGIEGGEATLHCMKHAKECMTHVYARARCSQDLE